MYLEKDVSMDNEQSKYMYALCMCNKRVYS